MSKFLRFFLACILCLFCSGMSVAALQALQEAESQSQVIFSWEGGETANVQGGSVSATNASGDDLTAEDVNMANSTYKVIRLRGDKSFSTYVVNISLDNALRAGDKIAITAYRNTYVEGKGSGALLMFEKGETRVSTGVNLEFVNINAAVQGTDEYGIEPNTVTLAVPEDADGSKTITMTCATGAPNLYITKIEITRDGEATTKVPEYLSLDELWSGWDSTYDSATHTITIDNSWGGKGWWLGDQDASDYAYFVVEFASPTTSGGKMVVELAGGTATGDEGLFEAGCTKKVIALPSGSEHLAQIFIQGPGGSEFVLQSAYFTNDEVSDGYYDGTPKVGKNLSVTDLTSGWDGSTYDSATRTITIGEDWGGKGWWYADADASDYDYLVIRFSVPTTSEGQVGIQLVESEYDTSTWFGENCKQLVIPLPTGKEHLAQIFIQGLSGSEYVLEHVYFSTASEIDETQIREMYWYPGTCVTDEEWQILKDYYDSVDNKENWNVAWDFSGGSPYVGNLGGVETEDGHVTVVNLDCCQLERFPVALLSLPCLERLSLSYNNMGDNLTELAESIAENTVLRDIAINWNQMTGNIGMFACKFSNLETLYASGNKIDEVSPMVAANVNLDLRYQTLEQKIDFDITKFTPNEIRSQLPEILLYDHYGQSYDNLPYFYFQSNENSFRLNMEEDGFRVEGDAVYRGKGSDELELEDVGGCKLKGAITFDQGDSNFDGDVNVLDLQSDINYIFGDYSGYGWWYSVFNFTAANLWEDEQINVQDVVPLVNLLMEKRTSGRTIFYESFDQCEGIGGNDSRWNGTDESEELVTDNRDWTFNYCAGANQCMRVGNSHWNGDAFSPDFDLDGQAVLCFRAAAGVGDNTHLSVYLFQYDEDTGYESCLKSEGVELQEGNWTEYEVQIEGHGRIYIGFTGGNCYLDDVKIVQIKDKSMVRRKVSVQFNPEATLTVSDGNLVLNTTKPVAAFDIVVDGATSMKVANLLKQQGFTTEVRKQGTAVHVIGYSLAGTTLPVGETVLGTLQNGATVQQAMLSDSKAKEIVVGFGVTSTSITQPAASDPLLPASEVYRMPVSNKKAIIFDNRGNKTLRDIER